MEYKLYVTDWAPNGTNDIIVTSKTDRLIDVLAEGAFGIDVNKLKTQIESDFGTLYPISKSQLRKHIAVSPMGINQPTLKEYLK